MYKQITNDHFEEIMMQSINKPIWLDVVSDTVSIPIQYPNFEFLVFKSGKYQFGHAEYDEENNYQNLMIDIDCVAEIHRNEYYMYFGEQIILTMIDGIQLILEFGY